MPDVKVRAIHSLIMSKNRTASPGAVFLADEDEAKFLVDAGAAEFVAEAAPAETEKPAE